MDGKEPTAWAIETIETPSYQTRMLLLGATGSGKTVVASQLIEPYPRVVIVDVKYDFPIPWEEGQYQVRDKPPNIGFVNALRWRFGRPRIVYRPKPPYDTGQHMSRFLDDLFNRARTDFKRGNGRNPRPYILYLDEAGWMSYQGARNAIARLAMTGRALDIGLWISSQRPRGIPVEVRSEAWIWLVFYLNSRDDRKEIVQYLDYRISEQDLESSTRDFEFWQIKKVEGGKREYKRFPPVRFKPGLSHREGAAKG